MIRAGGGVATVPYQIEVFNGLARCFGDVDGHQFVIKAGRLSG